jgi:Domain of unknown function (DUF4249)
MKKFLQIIYLLALGYIVISCDESVNTDAEFRERYVLTSIIDCDSERQIAFVTKTYDNTTSGINLQMETIYIHGADVKLWYKYNVFELNDTTIIDTNGKLINCYVTNDLKPEGDNMIEVEALLPNNLLLSANTIIPRVSKMRIESSNAGEIYNSPLSKVNISWTNIGNYIYDPKLVINYYFHSDTNSTLKEKIVPLDIIMEDSDTTIVYPKPTNKSSISIKKNALSNALSEISGNDPIKSNYVIVNLELKLNVYDENLSAFYYSSHQFLDQFSISLDTQLYSNIDSGLGIFASFISKNLRIGLDREYISSFGYRNAK